MVSTHDNSGISKEHLFVRQTSMKRRNSDSKDQDDFEDSSTKRGCPTTIKSIACPISNFGCVTELSLDDLLDHYSSPIHQECLMKAIESYVKTIHNKPFLEHSCATTDNQNYDEISDSVNLLTEGLSCLHDDSVNLHTKYLQINRDVKELQSEVVTLKTSIQETSRSYEAIQINNNVIQIEIETIKQMLVDKSSILSNNGSFIWKITDMAKKMADAMTDRQTSIYSPPFYSSTTGYKMCMRLYLNGDGQARRTHLSLFFVLMRGDYDAILIWPFQYKITFCLYDLSGQGRHIIDSFRPDVKSNSFQRPRSGMNIASGIPQFLPLAAIKSDNNSYIRDDCMFIRCMVDFASSPKTILPFMMNINPGLPSFEQQKSIQAEIEKQSAATSTNLNSKIEE